MALKGVIQGAGGTGGGQLAGSGVTSVGLTGPAPFITGPPVTSTGNLTFDFSGVAIPVSEGGTGMGSFAANSILQAGPNSTAPLTSIPLNNLTSNFLRGDGVFAAPPSGGGGGGAGTVTSVDLSLSSEFRISGNPVTGAGVLTAGFIQPLNIAHGGTGMGSFGPGVVLGGLTSTGPLQGLPLTNLTSTFLAGDGIFRVPINPAGTVQSVALAMTSEFAVQGTPILGSGTFTIGFSQPLAIAHGGTGLGSFGVGAIVKGGLTSTGPLQGLPLTNLTSNFLRGDGVFAVPPTPSGGTGTVTSVGLVMSSEFIIAGSPITSSGNFLGSWVFQTQNFIFGGPATGSLPGTPAFRALVNADIPQSMSGKTLSSSTFQNPTISTQVLTFGSSIKWNMNSGAIGLLGMDSTAIGTMDTPANVANTGSAILRVMQLGTGLPNLSWNAFWKFEAVAGVRTTPTLSSGFGNIDVVSLYMESTHAYGVARKNFT